jgi:ABC-type oligopeptide transport system ATPase subunit
MNLGIEEIVEVWFIPDHKAYSQRVLRMFASVDAAREYIKTEAHKFSGELAMVRVTIQRQRTA